MIRYLLILQPWVLCWLLLGGWATASATAAHAAVKLGPKPDERSAIASPDRQPPSALPSPGMPVAIAPTAAEVTPPARPAQAARQLDDETAAIAPSAVTARPLELRQSPRPSIAELPGTGAVTAVASSDRPTTAIAMELDSDHPRLPTLVPPTAAASDTALETKIASSPKAPTSVPPLLQQFLMSSAGGAPPPDEAPPAPASPPALAESPAPPPTSEALPGDPELGVIQVSEVSRDDELGVIQLRNPLQDAELGILELRQISPPPRRSPWLFLSAYARATNTDNVFLVEDPVLGRFSGTATRPGISLTAFPAIGPQTNLLVSARTSLLRYQEPSNPRYDELRFQAGVRHRFSRRVYGQFSLSHQLLFDEGYTDRFYTNTGIEVLVGRRDRLTPQLTLDSYYQGQVFFSDPERFSNVLNSVGASLNYRITNRWDTGVNYRLTVSDFTQQSRHETYQRITGELRYGITPTMRISVFGGVSYGRSSASRINFDDTFFGIAVDATVSIF